MGGREEGGGAPLGINSSVQQRLRGRSRVISGTVPFSPEGGFYPWRNFTFFVFASGSGEEGTDWVGTIG